MHFYIFSYIYSSQNTIFFCFFLRKGIMDMNDLQQGVHRGTSYFILTNLIIFIIFLYNVSLEKGSDQLFVTLYHYLSIPLYTNSWSEPFAHIVSQSYRLQYRNNFSYFYGQTFRAGIHFWEPRFFCNLPTRQMIM